MGRRRKELQNLKISRGQTSPDITLSPEDAVSPRKVAPLRISLQSRPPRVKPACGPCTLESKALPPCFVDLRSKAARKEAWITSQESKGKNRKAIEAEDKRIDTLFSKLPKPKKSYFLRELSAEDIRSIPMGEKQKTTPALEYVEGDTRPKSPCPPFENVTPPPPPPSSPSSPSPPSPSSPPPPPPPPILPPYPLPKKPKLTPTGQLLMEARQIPQMPQEPVPQIPQMTVPQVPQLSNLETGQTIDLPAIEASANLPTTRTADEAFLKIHEHLDRIQEQFSQLVHQPNLVGCSTVPLYSIKKEPGHVLNTSPWTRLPRLFQSQYTIAPNRIVLGSSAATTYCLSTSEIRKAEVTMGFTSRLSHLLFETLRLDQDFEGLLNLDRLPYVCQEYQLEKLLQPLMQVRSLSGITAYLEERLGKDSSIAKSAFDMNCQFQMAKINHSFSDENGTNFKASLGESLFSVTSDPDFLKKEYFPQLPCLPIGEELWKSLTFSRNNASIFDNFSFTTWIAAHDAFLGRAIVAPLWESGFHSHLSLLSTRPSTIKISPDSDIMPTPKTIRALKISLVLLASKIIKFRY